MQLGQLGAMLKGIAMPPQGNIATSVDAGNFREVMRQLAGCVTVITTEREGKLYGFTATAVCSVCAEPPTILIVVNKSARTHPHIDGKGAYAVNIIAQNQKNVAEHFAGKGENQFEHVAHTVGDTGVPLIKGAAAHLECMIEQRIAIGTHTIFVGRIIGTKVDNRKPLIYYDGKYGLVTDI